MWRCRLRQPSGTAGAAATWSRTAGDTPSATSGSGRPAARHRRTAVRHRPPVADPRTDRQPAGRSRPRASADRGGSRSRPGSAGPPPEVARPPLTGGTPGPPADRVAASGRGVTLAVVAVVLAAGGLVAAQRINRPLAGPRSLSSLPASLTVPGPGPRPPVADGGPGRGVHPRARVRGAVGAGDAGPHRLADQDGQCRGHPPRPSPGPGRSRAHDHRHPGRRGRVRLRHQQRRVEHPHPGGREAHRAARCSRR